MNKLRFIITLLLCIAYSFTHGQTKVNGVVVSEEGKPLSGVFIYNQLSGELLYETDKEGKFSITTNEELLNLLFYAENFKVKEMTFETDIKNLRVVLNEIKEELTEIAIKARRAKVFELKQYF